MKFERGPVCCRSTWQSFSGMQVQIVSPTGRKGLASLASSTCSSSPPYMEFHQNSCIPNCIRTFLKASTVLGSNPQGVRAKTEAIKSLSDSQMMLWLLDFLSDKLFFGINTKLAGRRGRCSNLPTKSSTLSHTHIRSFQKRVWPS